MSGILLRLRPSDPGGRQVAGLHMLACSIRHLLSCPYVGAFADGELRRKRLMFGHGSGRSCAAARRPNAGAAPADRRGETAGIPQ